MNDNKYSPELKAAIAAYLDAHKGKPNAPDQEFMDAAIADQRTAGKSDAEILASLQAELQPKTPPAEAKPPVTHKTALKAAAEGLGHALRTMIANRVADGTAMRNEIETAFENARNAAAGDVTAAHLDEAIAALKVARDFLANTTLRDPQDADVVKEAHAAAATAAATLKA